MHVVFPLSFHAAMKWTQLKTHGISCDLKTGRFWDPKSGPLAASFHVGPSTDLLHANLWRWVTPLWHNDADSALGGNSMRVAEVLLSPRLVWLSFKILKKKGILRDSTDFICASTSSQELCCWILDAFIEIILYHQRNGDLGWGWVPKFQGSSQETNGSLMIIVSSVFLALLDTVLYTCSDTDRRVVQLRTWAPIWWLSQIFGSWPKWTDTTRRCRAGSKGTVVSALGSFRWSEANDRPPFVSFGDLSHVPTQQKNHGIHWGYWGLPQKYAAIYCNEIYRKSITLLWRLPR